MKKFRIWLCAYGSIMFSFFFLLQIVEDKDTLISKLQKDVKEKDEEIADLKSQASKSGIGRSGTSDSDKRVSNSAF